MRDQITYALRAREVAALERDQRTNDGSADHVRNDVIDVAERTGLDVRACSLVDGQQRCFFVARYDSGAVTIENEPDGQGRTRAAPRTIGRPLRDELVAFAEAATALGALNAGDLGGELSIGDVPFTPEAWINLLDRVEKNVDSRAYRGTSKARAQLSAEVRNLRRRL